MPAVFMSEMFNCESYAGFLIDPDSFIPHLIPLFSSALLFTLFTAHHKEVGDGSGFAGTHC